MQDSVTFFFSHPSILHFLLTLFLIPPFGRKPSLVAWRRACWLACLPTGLICEMLTQAGHEHEPRMILFLLLLLLLLLSEVAFWFISFCSCVSIFLSLFYTRFNLFTLWRLSLSHVLNNWCQSWTGPAGHRYLHAWEQVFIGVNQRTGPMLW